MKDQEHSQKIKNKNRSEEVVVKPKLAVIAAALLKQVGSFHVTVLIVDQAQC